VTGQPGAARGGAEALTQLVDVGGDSEVHITERGRLVLR
jgi:hypothetical protein